MDSKIETPKRVFITGANGFIGKALARAYRAMGAEVAGVDLNEDPANGIVAGNIKTPDDWARHLAGCDLLLHTAAVVSMVAPSRVSWEINVKGTQRLLELAAQHGVRRFVQFSSVAAMGFDFPDGADETYPLLPNGNSYTDTKIASEHAVLAAHASGLIEGTIIRPGDVYGPESRAWIHEPLDMMRSGQFLLPANGKSVFSPIYIDDLVDGVVRAAGSAAGKGQIFILSGGEGVSTGDFFGHHWRWLGNKGAPRSLPTGAAVLLAEIVGRFSRAFGKPSEMGKGTVGLLSRSGTYSID